MLKHTEEQLNIDGTTVRTITPEAYDDALSPVVLLNGLGAGVNDWGDFPLQLDRQIIAVDVTTTLRLGLFGIVPMETYGNAARKAIDEVTEDTPDVVAISWGGFLGNEIVTKDPKRYGSLVLAATGPGGPPVTFNPPAWIEMLTDYDASRFINPLTYVQQLVAAGMCWLNYSQLASINNPTLILAGDNDPIAPLHLSRMLHAQIPHSQLHVVETSDHLFLLHRSAEMSQIVKQFLDQEVSLQLAV